MKYGNNKIDEIGYPLISLINDDEEIYEILSKTRKRL